MHKKGVQRLSDYTPYSSFDEPSLGYPSSGCSPAEPLSVSPNSVHAIAASQLPTEQFYLAWVELFFSSQFHGNGVTSAHSPLSEDC